MAILIVNSAPGTSRPIVDQIRAVSPSAEIWVVDHNGPEAYGETVQKYWHVLDVTFAHYSSDELNNTPAVDAEVITDLADLESAFIKMAEKNQKYNKFSWATGSGRIAWDPKAFPDVTFDYNARKANFIDHVRVWQHHLKNEVEAVIMPAPPNHGYDYVIFHLCRKLGVPFITFAQSPIYGRMLPYENVEGPNHQLSEEIKRLSQGRSDENNVPPEVQELFDVQLSAPRPPVPPYMTKTNLENIEYTVIPFSAKNVARFLFNLAVVYFRSNENAGKARKMAVFNYALNFIKQLRHHSTRAYYESQVRPADLRKNYVYLPLHYQPEISTSPLGGQYAHPELMASLIADTLPEGWELYIREHPFQRALDRSPQQYLAMARHPRVRILSIAEDNYELIKRARAVATVTGMAGLEALFRGVPVLVFGETVYGYAQGAFRIRSRADCVAAMAAVKAGIRPNIDDLKQVMTAAYNLSISGTNLGVEAYSSKYEVAPSGEDMQRNIASYLARDFMQRVLAGASGGARSIAAKSR